MEIYKLHGALISQTLTSASAHSPAMPFTIPSPHSPQGFFLENTLTYFQSKLPFIVLNFNVLYFHT